MSKFALALALLLPLSGIAAPAWAEDDAPITVNVNMARVLRINAPAATVIVGNPAVADVTIQDPQTLVSHRFSFSQQLDNCMQVRGGYSSDDTQNQLDLQLARNRWSVSMSRVQACSSNDMRFGIGYRLPLGGRTHDQESCRSAPAPAAAPSSIVATSVKRPDQFPQSPLTMVVSD